MGPKATTSSVVKQQMPQIKQEQMQARRRNIKCYACGKKGHTLRFCRSKPQVIRGMVEQESSAPSEEAHIDKVNSEDFTMMCCMTVGLWPSGIFSFYCFVHLLLIL